MVRIGLYNIEEASIAYLEGGVAISFNTSDRFADMDTKYGDAEQMEIVNGESSEFWFITGIISMKKVGSMATITFGVSKIGPDAEAEIRGGMSDTDDALLDLADLVSNHEERISALEAALNQ